MQADNWDRCAQAPCSHCWRVLNALCTRTLCMHKALLPCNRNALSAHHLNRVLCALGCRRARPSTHTCEGTLPFCRRAEILGNVTQYVDEYNTLLCEYEAAKVGAHANRLLPLTPLPQCVTIHGATSHLAPAWPLCVHPRLPHS